MTAITMETHYVDGVNDAHRIAITCDTQAAIDLADAIRQKRWKLADDAIALERRIEDEGMTGGGVALLKSNAQRLNDRALALMDIESTIVNHTD